MPKMQPDINPEEMKKLKKDLKGIFLLVTKVQSNQNF